MRIPIIRGVIDRRILVNYRVDAEVLARLLPPPFRPKLVHGAGMAGVCLIRLKRVRPRFLPPLLGIASEIRFLKGFLALSHAGRTAARPGSSGSKFQTVRQQAAAKSTPQRPKQ